MLIEELSMLAGDPVAWGAVPLLAVFCIYSLVHWWRCPLIHRTQHISLEEAANVVGKPVIAGPRFGLLMLAGVAATLAGLSFIAEGIRPTLAFYLLIAGVFVIQTEPARLQIREAEARVVTASAVGEEPARIAVERLETTNIWLISLQFSMLAAVVIFLAAF